MSGQGVPFLRGERVNLRGYDPADMDFLLAVWSDPAIRRITADPRPPSRAILEDDIRGGNERFLRFIIESAKDRRPMGILGLHGIDPHHRGAELGISLLDPADRGKGYGTEALHLALRYAFEELNLHRVALGVFDFNADARRLYESVGFLHEGTRREAVFKDGRYVDDHLFAILRPEWEKRYAKR